MTQSQSVDSIDQAANPTGWSAGNAAGEVAAGEAAAEVHDLDRIGSDVTAPPARADDETTAGPDGWVIGLDAARRGAKSASAGFWATVGKSIQRPLHWVAAVSPPVRVAGDILAILIVNEVTFNARIWPVFVAFLPVLAVFRLYAPPQGVLRTDLLRDLPRLAAASGVAAMVMALIYNKLIFPNLQGAIRSAIFMFVALVVIRGALYLAGELLRRRGYDRRKTLIVGRGHVVDQLIRKLEIHPEHGLYVSGVLINGETIDGQLDQGGHVIGVRPEDLPEIVTREDIQEIILVPAADDIRFVSECFMAVDGFKVNASLVPPLQDFLLSPSGVEHIEGIPLISLGRLSYAPRMMPGKRLMDVVGSALLLSVLSPLLLTAAIAIKWEDRGKVLFKQKRAGYRGRYFTMYKFRSMCMDAEARLPELEQRNETTGLLFKIEDDPRVTKVGRLLRRASIDELPQLFNVLKGDMSLVGPRALPVEIEKFADIAIKRLNVRPGCTGFWQILGRSDLTYEEMVKLDLSYIQNWSLWIDIQLILKTIPVILFRRGAY